MTTYHGSCFCGAVAFEAGGDLSDGTLRCNCRFCRKMRYWDMRLPDPAKFRVTRGREFLSETPRQKNARIEIHHFFCAKCGTRMWTEGDAPEMGGRFLQVCVAALDDAPEDELIAAPVFFADGANDAWWEPAAEIRHL
ncbi:GFA family protein [Paracoccus aerodenitrificans]|uniref:GFA family protein n=1 Tax=Paracoccus aerodenitrificans TaxID=3017781 RepID=UPI0022F13AC3|nr:GFA family protein [Paracoccus aerodenitrificans]WBU63135.1 GFA family protein [Paracoccus aerodenitrificans]